MLKAYLNKDIKIIAKYIIEQINFSSEIIYNYRIATRKLFYSFAKLFPQLQSIAAKSYVIIPIQQNTLYDWSISFKYQKMDSQLRQ